MPNSLPKIAACMIVRNSAETIEDCIRTIRPHVDEINIFDTGSTDDTLRILADLSRETEVSGEHTYPDGRIASWTVPAAKIRVERGKWRDDFAWARTQSFAMMSDDVDWVVWLDDDDEIENADQIRFLATYAGDQVDGFIFHYDYARDENGTSVCGLWRERLIRRDAGYTWRGEVHEVLLPPDGRAPRLAQVPPSQIRYVHHRPPSRHDPTRNMSILLAAAKRQEDAGEQIDPRTIAYLGTENMAQGAWQEAAKWLQAYLDHPHTGPGDERSQIHHKLATCLRMLGHVHAAVEVEFRALRERDDWAETSAGLTEAFAALGDWARVERWAKRTLELGQPHSMLILNPLEFTFLPLVRLAEAVINQGRFDEAVALVERAEAVAPNHPLLAERRAQYGQARYEAALVSSLLTLREAAVRHDENLSALRMLEAAPFMIRDHPAIVAARADQREMCRHYLEPAEYLRWYADEPKESTVDDDAAMRIPEWCERATALRDGLADQERELGRKPRVLDLGCNDFWMGAWLWKDIGVTVDGVELNRRSFDLALERRDRFAAPATIVHGDLHDAPKLLEPGTYDAVSLFEVIEHVPDIAATLDVCERMLRPGGRVYISTPNGAYERGNIDTWARVERKGHLRAMPWHELGGVALERGDIEDFHEQQQGRLAFVAYTPRRKKGRVVLFSGGAFEQWSPHSVKQGGIGGSETALVNVGVRLAEAGWKVDVYADCLPGVYAGMLWRPSTAWDPSEKADAVIVSRIPEAFDHEINAPVRVLWCHDHSYPGRITEDRVERMTSIVALSDWHRDRLERLYPFAADKLEIIRNGVTVVEPRTGYSRFPFAGAGFKDRECRVVYSSSADRGLDVLLEMWPDVRERVPDAELHVFYGFDTLDRAALFQPHLASFKAHVLGQVEAVNDAVGGVVLRGRVGQDELAAEMQAARVLAYPTYFLETSCITAMEARCSGLPVVTSRLGALVETVGKHGVLVEGGMADEDAPKPRDAEYRAAFVKALCERLSDESAWTKAHAAALRGIRTLDWSLRVREWEALIRAGKTVRRRRVAA